MAHRDAAPGLRAAPMADEGFHEIQLNGKQLVFLFMATTVIAVVIFLFGVMVGRGVQTARAGAEGLQEPATGAAGEPAPASAGTTPPGEAPPPAESEPVEDDDYYDRLVGEKQSESLKAPGRAAAAKSPPPAAKSAEAPKPDPRTTKPEPERLVRTDGDPTLAGRYAVQLAALRERNEAEAIAKRLVSKGYQAYVLAPAPGAPPVYRVQVGRFRNRSDADRTAARLRKEEQFTPWVTR
jgi:DedD protein